MPLCLLLAVVAFQAQPGTAQHAYDALQRRLKAAKTLSLSTDVNDGTTWKFPFYYSYARPNKMRISGELRNIVKDGKRQTEDIGYGYISRPFVLDGGDYAPIGFESFSPRHVRAVGMGNVMETGFSLGQTRSFHLKIDSIEYVLFLDQKTGLPVACANVDFNTGLTGYSTIYSDVVLDAPQRPDLYSVPYPQKTRAVLRRLRKSVASVGDPICTVVRNQNWGGRNGSTYPTASLSQLMKDKPWSLGDPAAWSSRKVDRIASPNGVAAGCNVMIRHVARNGYFELFVSAYSGLPLGYADHTGAEVIYVYYQYPQGMHL